MNKSTRHLVVVQNRVAKLQADYMKLKEKGLCKKLLLRRAEEIVELRQQLGLK